ncbi:MAG: cation diffusion facilitator family transporter, partial [Blastocatellia bacterium]
MSIKAASPAPELLRRVARLQLLTIAWMTVEAIVALAAAWTARSPALLAFGGDSAVELFSAIIVLWRFRSKSDSARAERFAARMTGGLLFVVAAFVIGGSGLSFLGYREPQRTLIGIILLIVAAFGMPLLASRKRKLAAQTGSASLRADAVESTLCGYMSWIALVGLLTNAVFHKPWADPVAALVLVPLIVKEGWEGVRASRPGCQ